MKSLCDVTCVASEIIDARDCDGLPFRPLLLSQMAHKSPMLHSIYDLTTFCRKTTGDVPPNLIVRFTEP